MREPSAVIVGGGIGGAVLANLLAKAQWRVSVFEKSVTPIRMDRHPNPIAQFERQRRAAAERSLRLSRGARRALALPDTVISRLALAALRIAGLRPGLFSPVLRMTSGTFATDATA